MFLTTRQAADDRSPWGNFWFEPVAVRTGAGQRVNADSAMRISAVYRAVHLISEQFACLPFVLFRRRADGTKEVVKDHWLLPLLCRRPNRWQNAFEWRAMMQSHLEMRGNAYNRVVPDGRGGVAALEPLFPDSVKVELTDSGERRFRVTQPGGDTRTYVEGEVWHLRHLSSNGITGMSTLEYARESLGVALATQDYAARFFANDARPSGGWIEFPGTFKDREARATFRETWQSMQGGEARGKTAVLDMGMKYHAPELTNQDAQFLETRKMQVTEIARWFGVPPHKLADLERATFSNIEHQALEFVQDCLMPRAEAWEASIEADVLLDSESDIEIEVDFRRLLRGDNKSRGAFYNLGIIGGWLTRNEARIDDNRDPLPGLDEPLRPLNMVEESAATDEADEGDDGADDRVPAPPARPSPDARMVALLTAQAQRLARRAGGALAKKPAADVFDTDFAALMCEALQISPDAAGAWCQKMRAADSHAEHEIARRLLTAALGS